MCTHGLHSNGWVSTLLARRRLLSPSPASYPSYSSESYIIFCLRCLVALSLCDSLGQTCLLLEEIRHYLLCLPLGCVVVVPDPTYCVVIMVLIPSPPYFTSLFTTFSAPAAFLFLSLGTHSCTSSVVKTLCHFLANIPVYASSLASPHTLFFSRIPRGSSHCCWRSSFSVVLY